MIGRFLKANPSIKKKDIKRKLKMIESLTGVKLSMSDLVRYNDSDRDELAITLTTAKFILSNMGYNISSHEVRLGDTVVFKDGEWESFISSSNHSNKLTGIFTELEKNESKIGNFTRLEHIEKVKSLGGATWEDWYEESAKASALRQTIKLSSLAILVKPIAEVVKVVKETGEIKDEETALTILEQLELEIKNTKNLEENTALEAPATEAITSDTVSEEKEIVPVKLISGNDGNNMSTENQDPGLNHEVEQKNVVIRPPEEVFSEEEAKEVLVNLKEIQDEASKEKPPKNLSRVKWMEARDDIEERFRNGETKEELAEDITMLESRKPYGIKSEVINLSITEEPVVEEVIEPVTEPATEEIIELDEMSTPFDPEPVQEKGMFPENMSAEEWIVAHRELDKLWKAGEFGESINRRANKLLDVMPSSIGGTILTREDYKERFESDKKMEPSTKQVETSTGESADSADFNLLVDAWKTDRLTLETKWRNREISDEEAMENRDRLIDSVPSGFGAGVIKVGKSWEEERIPLDPISETEEHKATTSAPVEKMTVRAWMGGYGKLEKRFKEEGGSEELYEVALNLQSRRPDNIKDGMVIPNKYRGQEA